MRERVALVTGASRGIGRSTALALAARGARVMAVARTASELASLRDQDASISYTAASLDEEAGCRHAIEQTRRLLGPVEIVVNNAAVGSADDGAIWDQPLDALRRTMTLNLEAAFLITQEASRDMRAAGYGRIVMVASTSGVRGAARNIAYTTSKHAMVGLMRAVAQDVGGFGGTCNAVLPGWVHTAMADRSAARTAERQGISVEEVWRERDALYPRGRSLQPEEVAEVIAFLCSDAAGGVNGDAISVAAGASE